MIKSFGVNSHIFVALLAVCCYAEQCGVYHSLEYKHIHTHKNGTTRCCVRRLCAPGTHGVLCYEHQPASTQCQACTNDSFSAHQKYSYQKMECHQKKLCNVEDGFTIVDNGSTTEDRVCGCDLSRGYYTQRGPFNIGTMCVVKLCPAGQQLSSNGSCTLCAPGSYKPTENHHRCVGWTDCHALNYKLLEYGTRTKDSVCVVPPTDYPTPKVDYVREETDSPLTVTLIALACVLLVSLPIILGVYLILRRRAIDCNDSNASSSEKQTLDRDVSFSDSEEHDNKANHLKGPHNLSIMIPSAPIQESEYPKSSTTPDSGIVSDLKQMNGVAPMYTSSPISGPNKTVETDSAPFDSVIKDGCLPVTMIPSFPQMHHAEGSCCDGGVYGVSEKGAMPQIVVQNNGPVYLQYGTSNNMSAGGQAQDDSTTQYILEDSDDEARPVHV